MKKRQVTLIIIVVSLMVAFIVFINYNGHREFVSKYQLNNIIVSDLVIELKLRSRLITVNVDKDDYDAAIGSLKAGLDEVDNASSQGKMLAWAPIGTMKVNDKSYPWFSHSTDPIVKKYILKYFTDE